jgi:hypothetical protein
MAKNRSTKRCHSRSKRGGGEPDGPDVDPTIIAYKEEKIKAAEAQRQQQAAIKERQQQAAIKERQRQAAAAEDSKLIPKQNGAGKSRRRRHRRSRYHRNSRHANKNNKSRKGRKSSTRRMRNRISGRSKRGGLIESPNKKRIKAILGFNDPNFNFSDVNAVLTPEKMNEIYDNVWKNLQPVEKFDLVDEFNRGLPHGQVWRTTHPNRRPLYAEMCKLLHKMDIEKGVTDSATPWPDAIRFGPRKRSKVHPFPNTPDTPDTPVLDQRLPGIETEETNTSAPLLTPSGVPSGGKSRRHSHRRRGANKKSRKGRKSRRRCRPC